MQPIDFKEANKTLNFANGQQMRFFHDELTQQVIMLWQFTPEEVAKFAETGQLYISQVLGQTALPMLEVPFREATEEEKQLVEKRRKQVRTKMLAEQRKGKPRKLKFVK